MRPLVPSAVSLLCEFAKSTKDMPENMGKGGKSFKRGAGERRMRRRSA